MSEPLEQIHDTSLRILSELGVKISHAEMRQRLHALGCEVDRTTVTIPPYLVAEALQAIPRSFRLYGRNDSTGVLVNANGPFLCTNTGILPNIYDFESGVVRRSTLADVVTTTRLLDALSEVDLVYASLVDATELPAHMSTVADFAATLANTTKPLVGPGPSHGKEASAIVSIALAARGGEGPSLASRPPCMPFIGALSPLRFTDDSLDALLVTLQAGLPLLALTNPIAGVTAPFTLAGTVALGHAEVLALAVMAYAIRPGTPLVSFNTPSITDMRTLAATTGGPEAGMLRALAVSVARWAGIPSWGHGHTSSTSMDVQAADEKATNELLIAQAHPSLLGGLGGLANVTLTSYETLVLDNERFAAVRRILRGVDIDEDHLAYSVCADLAQGGDVISHTHTVQHLRGGEYWKPRLARRQGLVSGEPDRVPLLERARGEAKRIMQEHSVAILDPAIQAQIDLILHEFDREMAPA